MENEVEVSSFAPTPELPPTSMLFRFLASRITTVSLPTVGT